MRYSQSLIVTILTYLITDTEAQWYLRCRLCDRAKAFEDCNNFQTCSEGEMCFVDEIITEDLRTVFEAGCRSTDVCTGNGAKRAVNLEKGLTIKKREEILSCSRCCDSMDYCNDQLCGLEKSRDDVLCNSCDGKEGRPQPPAFPEDCQYFRFCGQYEMCYSSTIATTARDIEHYTTCKDKTICQTLTKYMVETYSQADHSSQGQTLLGKRALGPICTTCCGDELCNKYACSATKRRMIDLYDLSLLNMTTLKEII